MSELDKEIRKELNLIEMEAFIIAKKRKKIYNKEKQREAYLRRRDKVKEYYVSNKDKHKKRNNDYYSSVEGKTYHKKRYNKQSQNMLWYERIFNNITRSNNIKKKKGIVGTQTDFDAEFIFDLYKKQEGKCAYFGIPMHIHSTGKRYLLNPSLDRIDNTIGYIKSNIVLCTLMANHARNDAIYDEWISVLEKYFHKKTCSV
jgi:hypothetical protein